MRRAPGEWAVKDKPEPPDAELFRQALDGVTRLPPSNRVAPARPKPAPFTPAQGARPALADTWSDHGTEEEPPAEFARNGISRMTLRKLRRGQFAVEDSLDLHGLSSDAARALLLQFMGEALRRGLRCVRIVHGKGRQADGGPGILKVRARHWLAQCAEVLAFCEAPPAHGGGGAVLVLLRAGAELA